MDKFLESKSLQNWIRNKQNTYQDFFSTAQRGKVLELVNFDAFECFCHFFIFASSTSAKCFPLRTFFIQEANKKVTWGETGWIGRVGHGGHAVFGQKLLNTQHSVGRYTYKSPIMKCANSLKQSSKKFTEAKHSLSQQHQLGHWYRWVPRTLT